MNDLFGILITFGPLILIILFANLAERGRERAALAQVEPTLVNGTPQPESLPALPSTSPQESLPASLTDMPSDPYTITPFETSPALQPVQPVSPVPPVASAPASDGTVWAIFAYALMSMYFVASLAGAAMGSVVPLMLANPTPELEAYLAEFPYLARFNWSLLVFGTAATVFFGIMVMLRPIRRLLARIIPIDPLSTVHSVALSMVSLVVLQMVFTAGVGIDVLADMVTEGGDATSGAMTITTAWVQAGLFVLMGFVGVGWLVRRSTHATRIRLAIVMPTIPQALVAIGLAFVMVGMVLALEVVSNSLGWGFDEDVGRLSEQLLGGLILTVPGILTLGLSAGIGEETLMRGALQPRFGLVLTSIIFALLHGNYGLTLSTLAVLIVGFTLGLLRNRTNTTAAMIMHATYNCILGFLPFLWQQ